MAKDIRTEDRWTPGAATARLAAAMGWDRLPELDEDEAREADAQLAAAQEAARRRYGRPTAA
jgi:hypothetical protein